MYVTHKGCGIKSVAWPRSDTGKFKCQVSILWDAGGSMRESPETNLEEEFDTPEQAEQFGVRSCIEVIDGKVPKWWVS